MLPTQSFEQTRRRIRALEDDFYLFRWPPYSNNKYATLLMLVILPHVLAERWLSALIGAYRHPFSSFLYNFCVGTANYTLSDMWLGFLRTHRLILNINPPPQLTFGIIFGAGFTAASYKRQRILDEIETLRDQLPEGERGNASTVLQKYRGRHPAPGLRTAMDSSVVHHLKELSGDAVNGTVNSLAFVGKGVAERLLPFLGPGLKKVLGEPRPKNASAAALHSAAVHSKAQ